MQIRTKNHTTVFEMTRQVELAKSEQQDDEKTNLKLTRLTQHNLNYLKGVKDPQRTKVVSHTNGAMLLSRNKRGSQEDRADYILCEKMFAKRFLSLSLEEKGKLLFDRVTKMAANVPARDGSGATLTASFIWTTVDEMNQDPVCHILTAQVGDSRAILFTNQSITRLTRDHSLKRQHERDEVTQAGFTFQENGSDNQLVIMKDGECIAFQDKEYLRLANDLSAGMQIARSLGDHNLHESAAIFRSVPDISYYSVPMSLKPCLITCSDGVTTDVSENNLAEILQSIPETAVAAQFAARLACARGSEDNISIVMTNMEGVKPGEVVLQFVSDGHGGKQTADFVVEHLMRYNGLYKAQLLKQMREEYEPYHIASINAVIQAYADEQMDVDLAEERIDAIIADISVGLTEKIPQEIVNTKWDIRFSFFGGTRTKVNNQSINLPGHVSEIVTLIDKHREGRLSVLNAYHYIFHRGHEGYLNRVKDSFWQKPSTREYYDNFKDGPTFENFCRKKN